MISPEQKRSEGASKLSEAFGISRPAIQLGGVAATDPRFAVAAVNAGVRVLEPNHTAITCSRARGGITSMREAYQRKHELEFDAVLETVSAIRRAVPENIFILCAAPGTFDEPEPEFEGWQAEKLSEAGADGLFIEKDEYNKIERLIHLAHDAGLLVQASFQLHTADMKTAVIPIYHPHQAPETARKLREMGVDIVGLRFSGIFESLEAGAIAPEELECLSALITEVPDSNVVYAGVNAKNLPVVAQSGVTMVGIASAVDDLVYKAMGEAIDQLLPGK